MANLRFTARFNIASNPIAGVLYRQPIFDKFSNVREHIRISLLYENFFGCGRRDFIMRESFKLKEPVGSKTHLSEWWRANPSVQDVTNQAMSLENEFRVALRRLHASHQKTFSALDEERLSVVIGLDQSSKYGNDVRSENVVPNFWRDVLMHHPVTKHLVRPRDEYALGFLNDIRSIIHENAEGLTIEMDFAENKIFSECTLRCTFKETPTGLLLETSRTPIPFHNGVDRLTKRQLTLHRMYDTLEYDYNQSMEEKIPSFFDFFLPAEESYGWGVSPVEDEGLRKSMMDEADHVLAQVFATEVVPCALALFERRDSETFYDATVAEQWPSEHWLAVGAKNAKKYELSEDYIQFWKRRD
eukprot:Rmarinus@m.2295